MPQQALSDLKVVEYGDFISAPYCGKLLADLGAEVIKVEPPGTGDSSRRYGPFPNDEPDTERSLLYAYMNTNKLGISLDVQSPLGKKIFKALLQQADVLIENYPPKFMHELGLDHESLHSANPGLIVTSITSFGQSGQYRDYKGTDLISFHMGGIGYPTSGDVDDPDNYPPLKGPGHQADIMAAITGAAAAMSALMARRMDGVGRHVDISEQEALVRAIGGPIVSHVSRGETPNRIAGMDRPISGRKPLRAKDGYFSAQMLMDQFWPSMKKVLGYPEWAEQDVFNDRTTRSQNIEVVTAHVEEWAKDYTTAEVFQILQVENHIPCLPVNTMEDVFTHPHFIERGTFVQMEHPDIGTFQAPGPPYDFSLTPWQIKGPAPRLGQHNGEIMCSRLGYSKEELVKMKQLGVI